MEPNKKDLTKVDKGPPSPWVAFFASLLGYPGVGHFMVGKKREGAIVIVVFTALTIGVIWEIFAIASPLLRAYTEGVPPEFSVNWGRIGFWIVATGVVWVGSSFHAMHLASKMQKTVAEVSTSSDS